MLRLWLAAVAVLVALLIARVAMAEMWSVCVHAKCAGRRTDWAYHPILPHGSTIEDAKAEAINADMGKCVRSKGRWQFLWVSEL